MTQSSLWQHEQKQNLPYAELCNALYEREVASLASGEFSSPAQIQARLKSLTYYVSRTAYRILQTKAPIPFDVQNASWSHKQSNKLPIKEQTPEFIQSWYQKTKIELGLVVPVLVNEEGANRILLDSIDRVDSVNHRIRSNYFGWYDYQSGEVKDFMQATFLKPTKKTMIAACCGHQWQSAIKTNPMPLDLRELLLTCSINWKNLARPFQA